MHIGKFMLKMLLSAFFAAAGSFHFVKPAFYAKMMPSFLPVWLHFVAGICEIILALGLWTQHQSLAAKGMIALLIAVYPANIKAAMWPEIYPEIAPWKQIVRLPFQFLFIAWAYMFV